MPLPSKKAAHAGDLINNRAGGAQGIRKSFITLRLFLRSSQSIKRWWCSCPYVAKNYFHLAYKKFHILYRLNVSLRHNKFRYFMGSSFTLKSKLLGWAKVSFSFSFEPSIIISAAESCLFSTEITTDLTRLTCSFLKENYWNPIQVKSVSKRTSGEMVLT